MFNILAKYGVEGSTVADLFAGTGSLGIEALSRGAAHADFIEADRREAAVIKANLQATGFAQRASVHTGRVESLLNRLGRYDFLMMDPPYTQPFPTDVITRIGEADLLAEGGVLVCGHASRASADDRCGALIKWADRRYGDASLAFYSRDGEVSA